jgi:hypothetical protein
MQDELKPCPFCGSKVSITYSSLNNTFNVYHTNTLIHCKMLEPIQIDGYYVKTLAEAKEAWNRRTV